MSEGGGESGGGPGGAEAPPTPTMEQAPPALPGASGLSGGAVEGWHQTTVGGGPAEVETAGAVPESGGETPGAAERSEPGISARTGDAVGAHNDASTPGASPATGAAEGGGESPESPGGPALEAARPDEGFGPDPGETPAGSFNDASTGVGPGDEAGAPDVDAAGTAPPSGRPGDRPLTLTEVNALYQDLTEIGAAAGVDLVGIGMPRIGSRSNRGSAAPTGRFLPGMGTRHGEGKAAMREYGAWRADAARLVELSSQWNHAVIMEYQARSGQMHGGAGRHEPEAALGRARGAAAGARDVRGPRH